MRTTDIVRAFSIAGLALITLAPTRAVAQQSDKPGKAAIEQARTHFLRGADLFKEGNYQAALVEFKRANQVAPNYRILYNIGQTYQELQNYTGALDAFQRYLEAGGPKIDAERRAYVEQQIEKLRGRVAAVKIITNVEGADVLVDDTQVGTTPLSGPLLVSAGKRTITLSKPPAVPIVKHIEVAGGDRIELKLDMAPSPTASSGLSTSRPIETKTVVIKEEKQGMGTGFWVGLTTTGALAAGAAITGVLALSARGELDSELDRFPTTAKRINDARDKTKTLALVSDILTGAAVVSGGLTIYFASSGPDSDEPPPSGASPQVGLVIAPTSVSLAGQF